MFNKDQVINKFSVLVDNWEAEDIKLRQSGCGPLGHSGALVEFSNEELVNELILRLSSGCSAVG